MNQNIKRDNEGNHTSVWEQAARDVFTLQEAMIKIANDSKEEDDKDLAEYEQDKLRDR